MPKVVKKSPAAKRAEKRKRRPDLSYSERERLRNKVAAITCSTKWEDAAYVLADEQGIQPHSKAVPELLAKFGIYPPPPDHGPRGPREAPVLMHRCCLCGHVFPPQYLVGNNGSSKCLDCITGPQKVLSNARPNAKRHGVSPLQRRETGKDAHRAKVYQRLRHVGFNDREIAVLSLWLEGHSLRQIGEWSEISHQQVYRLLESAKLKARMANVELPRRKETHIRAMDPRLMDQRFAALAC